MPTISNSASSIRLIGFALGFILLAGTGCQGPASPTPTLPTYPSLPGLAEPIFPEDNPLKQASVQLGRMLFYDPVLSRDSTISCSSCHRQALAFTDAQPVSVGIEGRKGTRNTPTLVNMAYQPYFFAEGGSPSLELQVLGPVETRHEMDLFIGEAARRANRHPVYRALAQEAYGREVDPFVLTRALASFERTLIGFQSPFDRYYYQGDTEALTASQERGMELFFSEELDCASCHAPPLFTDHGFYKLGLPVGEVPDLGRYRVTLDSADIGTFKTPTLRNVALTPPYMHDGSIPTLEAAISYVLQGGQYGSELKEVTLSKDQKLDLIHFLESLTDTAFIRNPAFGPPSSH